MPEPKPFTAEDMHALIEGSHATTLAYRPSQLSLDQQSEQVLPLTVLVEMQGEPRMDDPGESCQVRIVQDVVVTLSLDASPLDVVIETTAHAFSKNFTVIQQQLDDHVAAALGLPRAKVTFSLAFDANGIEGTIDPNDGCGLAVFPADVHCVDWSSVEISLDRERDGFRPRDALSVIGELGDVPLQWVDGGTTTLAVSLLEDPTWACSGDWVETFCPETLHMPVSIQATAADGSVDAELPAELTVSVSTEGSTTQGDCGSASAAGEIEQFSIIASNVEVAASALGAQVWNAERGDAALTLHLWRSAGETFAEARLTALELVDPGLSSPLDSTVDAAGASCVVNPGGARPETR
jgi:hypothetical protein